MNINSMGLIVVLLGLWALPSFADHNHQRIFQVSEMISLTDFTPQGAATLTRTKNRIHGRVMVNVDTAGEPYTVWWVVFNNPSACRYTPCTVIPQSEGGGVYFEDLLNRDIGVAIYNASGAISAANGSGGGVLNLDFKTVAGKQPKGLFVLDWVDGTPFAKDRLAKRNGLGAEVHLVVDRHPALKTWSEELTSTNYDPNFNHRAAIFLAP